MGKRRTLRLYNAISTSPRKSIVAPASRHTLSQDYAEGCDGWRAVNSAAQRMVVAAASNPTAELMTRW